jgi:hypothetical protein
MEVSMPTGSLCSERNVIGTALAADHTLHRHQLRMIAVLSVTLHPPTSLPESASGGGESISASMQPPMKRVRTSHSKEIGIFSGGTSSASGSPLRVGVANVPKHRNEAGINPTSPCGSCNEWLKKIAELNPDFKGINYT